MLVVDDGVFAYVNVVQFVGGDHLIYLRNGVDFDAEFLVELVHFFSRDEAALFMKDSQKLGTGDFAFPLYVMLDDRSVNFAPAGFQSRFEAVVKMQLSDGRQTLDR